MSAKLNLRPGERRLLVVVGFAIFVVLNFWLVRPKFSDWGRVKIATEKTRTTLATYQKEVARHPGYQTTLVRLQSTGSDILSEELQLQRIVQTQASANGVVITKYDPRLRATNTRTNQFFEDQMLTVDFTTGGKELVDFLVNLAAGNSMIRVREMTLRPDPSQTKLMGSINLVASYQKRAGAATKPATTGRTNAPAPARATPNPKP